MNFFWMVGFIFILQWLSTVLMLFRSTMLASNVPPSLLMSSGSKVSGTNWYHDMNSMLLSHDVKWIWCDLLHVRHSFSHMIRMWNLLGWAPKPHLLKLYSVLLATVLWYAINYEWSSSWRALSSHQLGMHTVQSALSLHYAHSPWFILHHL